MKNNFCYNAAAFFDMNLTQLFVLSLGFSLGFAFADDANEPVIPDYSNVKWADGVGFNEETGRVEGWYDAEKTQAEDADDPMCYAASASNLLAWWQNSPYAVAGYDAVPKDLQTIWSTFKNNNQIVNVGGTTHCAINWWLSGVYAPSVWEPGSDGAEGTWALAPEDDPMWDRHFLHHSDFGASPGYPVTLPNYQGNGEGFRGYYYDQCGLSQEDLTDFLVDVWIYQGPLTPEEPDADGEASSTTHRTQTLGEFTVEEDEEPSSIYDINDVKFMDILEDSAISLAILSDDNAKFAHSLTLWGVEYEGNVLTKLWLTDSDDKKEDNLFSVSVTLDDEANKIYFGEWVDEEGKYISDYLVPDNVYICSIHALDTSLTSSWRLVPEPTTTTLSLLTLAGLAARLRRR